MNRSHIPVLYLNPEKQTPSCKASLYTPSEGQFLPLGSAALSVILTIQLDKSGQLYL